MKNLHSLLMCGLFAFGLVACSHNPEVASNDEFAEQNSAPVELAMNQDEQQVAETPAAQEVTSPAPEELVAAVEAMETDLANAPEPQAEQQPEVAFNPMSSADSNPEMASLPAPSIMEEKVTAEPAGQMVAAFTERKPEPKVTPRKVTAAPAPKQEVERATLPTTQPVTIKEEPAVVEELAKESTSEDFEEAPKAETQVAQNEPAPEVARREVQEANPSVEGFLEQHPFAIALTLVGFVGVFAVLARVRRSTNSLEL